MKAKAKKGKQLIGGSNEKGKAYFNDDFGTKDRKPLLAVQDSSGRIQCMEAPTKEEAEKTAKKLRKDGFTVLVGVG